MRSFVPIGFRALTGGARDIRATVERDLPAVIVTDTEAKPLNDSKNCVDPILHDLSADHEVLAQAPRVHCTLPAHILGAFFHPRGFQTLDSKSFEQHSSLSQATPARMSTSQ